MGEAHYNQALGDQTPSASFFVSFARDSSLSAFKTKKPSGGLPPEGSKIVSKSESSRRLTNGGPGESSVHKTK